MYEVTVHTGDLWNGGTEATVFITLYGERGDTGVREFYKIDGQPNLQKGQVSVVNWDIMDISKIC